MPESPGRAFWLCHECGAQMRPMRIDGVRQCASCNSEFIEILDPEVNPDPAYELPPAPPVRPSTSPTIPGNRPHSPPTNAAPSITDVLSGMFTGVFGGGGDEQPHPHANQQDQQAGADNTPFGRTFQFNIGGGSGSVTFGTIGGGGGGGFQPFGQGPGQGGRGGRTLGGGGFGPFGPVPEQGGDQGGGLDAFFPGFPPAPPGHGQQGQGRGRTTGGQQGPAVVMQGGDLFRVLMNVLGDEGIPGVANVGDYATSEQGFAQILEQLMQAAGPQGPLPATDAVIEGLPRVKLDEDAIEKSSFKDCPVCKDDFVPGDEIMRVPCQHIFHVDCLQPWLKTNGSCPVCRFSLVPDEGNQARPSSTQTPAQQNADTGPPPTSDSPVTGPSGITNILHRLWGQSGSPSQPSSPTSENPPQATPSGQAGSNGTRIYEPPATPPPGSTAESDEMYYTPPASLPPGVEQPTPDQVEVGMSEADRHARARDRMNRDFRLSPRSLVERGFNPSPQELRDDEMRRSEEQERYAAQARARNEQRLRNEARGLYGTVGGSETRASGQVEAEERLPTSIPEDYRERHRQKELEESRQREARQSQQRDSDPYLDDLD